MDRPLEPCEWLSRGRGLIRLTLLMLVISIFLALAGCQAFARKAFPEGKYSGPVTEDLILKEGNYIFLSRFHNPPFPIEDGNYTVDGDQITFHVMNKFNGMGCDEDIPSYIYQWAFDPKAQTLTFKRIYDPCEYRNLAFTWKYLQGEE